MPETSLNPLIERWNTAGRDFMSTISALIRDHEEGRETPKHWPVDPRSVEEASTVISGVEVEYRAGRWNANTPIADRAQEPIVPMLDDVCQSIRHVTILGRDEFLLRLGSPYQPGTTLHLHGGDVHERPDIMAATATRSHELLLIVRADGFHVTTGLEHTPVCHFPWPEGLEPGAIEDVHLSEDGGCVAFVQGEQACWLGRHGDTGAIWTRIFPSDALIAETKEENDGNGFWDSMMHCALSPDGRFIAYGSQCHGHFIDRLDEHGHLRRWARIGHLSEYPHHACFSDDSTVAALNSCHFYHGATVAVRLRDIEGLDSDPYEPHKHVTEINPRLRVYAATWLPAGIEPAFALAGAGYLDVATADGQTLSLTHFGSTASSIDYCPRTGQLAVGAYSGFLHIFDPTKRAEEGRAIGYCPIQERYRWVLWRDRPPFRW